MGYTSGELSSSADSASDFCEVCYVTQQPIHLYITVCLLKSAFDAFQEEVGKPHNIDFIRNTLLQTGYMMKGKKLYASQQELNDSQEKIVNQILTNVQSIEEKTSIGPFFP